MGLVDLLWITAALLTSPLLTLCQPLYILSAPQIMRVAKPERVLVEIQDCKELNPINVNIKVMSYPRKDRDLIATAVTLKPKDNFQALVDIKIPFIDDVFETDPDIKQYVFLRATFDGPQIVEKAVMVSFQSGYIFIQTDKTIYTPDSTVRYRVFPLTIEAKATVSPVVVEIVTPEGIIIQRDQYTSSKSLDYKLGSPISNGIWKIAASFKDSPDKNFTAEFEVKEYVLPSFEVKLNPKKSFFYTEDKEFHVEIKAKYLFGLDVEGSAFVVFGVFNDSKKISIPSSLARVDIKKGQGEAVLKRDHILQTFKNIDELVGKTMYMSASVLTEAGSEMVEAERRGIHIVKAPYTIHFTRTPKYFKPGMPFDFRVYVTNPDETPADKVAVLVTPGEVTGITDKNGIAKIVINTQKGASTLDITVCTVTEGIPAEKKMTAYAYKPKEGSQNYLHIDITTGLLNVGNQVTLKLNLGTSTVGNQDFTYMVLSKGRIITAERFRKSDNAVIAVPLTVTKEMLPSFRVVAYYHVGSSEVVADSIWVDVEDTCMGSLKVNVEQVEAAYAPNDVFALKITGDPGAKVGLVAVDKGIYVLNNKNRLTQTKIWDTIEKHDLACTAGSGKDSMGVFYDAGLLFSSNSAGGTLERRDLSCSSEQKRKRRDLSKTELRKTLVGSYSENLRHCCMDGMVNNLLGYTCERRAEYVEEGDECRQAFLSCCKKMTEARQETIQEELILARSEEEDGDDMFDDITTRSFFPESWMWMDETLPQCKDPGKCQIIKDHRFPESITTWVVTAISMSTEYGICVADPVEFIVRKGFFVDLKLPYSAVVNEQIEIKAIVHNLGSSSLDRVTVELKETQSVCSLASYKKKYRTTVSIGGKSSRAVPFIIIPLAKGEHDIEVTVRDPNGFSDGVRKKLKVVTQGILRSTGEQTLILEPEKHGGTQRSEIKRSFLDNQMPDTEAHTYIAVRGRPMAQLIKEAISGKGLESLIKKPRGCAEQNLLAMVLPLLAANFLDKTNQWEDVGVEKRPEALGYITAGYINELSYLKSDGSFAVFPSLSGSTWLTAYVVRMFSMADSLVSIDHNVICNAVKWLILNAQMPDGVFRELYSVSSSAMQGKASPLTMTAFVLIALQEAKPICIERVSSLQPRMDAATEYIARHIASETDPYAVAMVSYALANANKLQLQLLFRYASPDASHWPVDKSPTFTLEATGYALMALLKIGDFKNALPVVQWLKINQNFHSTQATAVVFQALAKYLIEVPPKSIGKGMEVTVTSTERSSSFKNVFTKASRGLQRSGRFPASGDLKVEVSGEGEGSMSVVTGHYTKPYPVGVKCKNFDLDVMFIKMETISYYGALASYTLSIGTKFLKDRESTMTVLDISLLTGFLPDAEDLQKLMGTNRHIQRFDMDRLSNDASLIIYLKKVSNVDKERITFRMHKKSHFGLLQPASIKVYEYNDEENHCVKFYDAAERINGMLRTICPTDVCSCAEVSCTLLKNTEVLAEDKRFQEACERKDFVYKANLKDIKQSDSADIYTFTIIDILKEGSDPVQPRDQRNFWAHSQCKEKLNLKMGKDYLIMGPEPKKIDDSYHYLFGVWTWLEYWPTIKESLESRDNRLRYNGLLYFSYYLQYTGCTK
uniref:Anaphylatoxin-like domain-containing protein n=1 Tax=Pygocentrus nattereri TaxID=42514 RepID=A0AAR2JP78_PYGNA